MKTQINLLQAEFRPHFKWISGTHLLTIMMCLLVISGISYGGLRYYQSDLQAQVNTLNTQIQTTQAHSNELVEALEARTSDPVLENKLRNLKSRINERTILLNNVTGLSSLKQRAFSTFFDGLSQAHSPKLWLTLFSVTPTELSLQGRLTEPAVLPSWIKQLSTTPFFKGQAFNIASMNREDDYLHFELTNVPSNLTEENIGGKNE